jgi:hypothetical protein
VDLLFAAISVATGALHDGHFHLAIDIVRILSEAVAGRIRPTPPVLNERILLAPFAASAAGEQRKVLVPAVSLADMLGERAVLLIGRPRQGTKVRLLIHRDSCG